MSSLRALAYGAARAARGVGRRKLGALLATGAIAVSLLLVGLFYLAGRNVEALGARWGHGVQMVVYLADETSRPRADAIADALRGLPAVEGVTYVTPETAYRRLRGTLGERTDLLDGVEVGILPASLEVALRAGVVDVAAVHPVVERLRQTPGVEDVEFIDDWVGQLTALVGTLRQLTWALALIAGLACLYIVGCAIKLAMQTRAGEAEVLRLLGASRAFVRAPLLLEGLLQGAIGAAVAALLLWGVYAVGAGPLERALAAVVGDFSLAFLPARQIVTLIAGGAALGLVGSWIALERTSA